MSSCWSRPNKEGKRKAANTLSQCRTLLSPYLSSDKNTELEEDIELLLAGLSETAKYPGR